MLRYLTSYPNIFFILIQPVHAISKRINGNILCVPDMWRALAVADIGALHTSSMKDFCKNCKWVVFLPFKTQSTYGEFGSSGGIHSLKRQPSRTNFSKFRNISKKIPTRSREVGSIIQPRHIKTMQRLENRNKVLYTICYQIF